MTDLRPYQRDVLARLKEHPARRKLLVAPTGSGKTVIASELIRSTGAKALFIAHRREIIHQTAGHLAEFGVEAEIILAGHEIDPDAYVQVASLQTLWTRAMVRKSTELPAADMVIVDETHHCRAQTYRRLIDSYPKATIIGLTATPCRGDGRGLGNVFEALIACPQVQELIDLKWLVPTRVYAPATPDLTGVHTRHGDYVQDELAERVDQPGLVGDIVTHWHRLAEHRKTVVFATSVSHSIHLAEEFQRSGVKVEHIDGSTPKEERDEILGRLSHGDLEVVTNCMVLTEGWDQPDVACIVLARPTKHMGLYRQMIGRGLRPYPDKPHCLVLDHAGATFQHGFVEDAVTWTLDEDKRAEAPAHRARGEGAWNTSRLLACSECSAIRTAGRPCPACGHMPRRHGEHLDVADGDLAHVTRAGRVHPHHYSAEDRHRWHQELVGYAAERGYRAGWAAHKFKERFGSFPQQRYVEPLTPSAEVRSWARSRVIAYAKAMQKASASG